MSEPYPDEEFEKRRNKVVFETSYEGLVTQEDYDRLIATVESLKKKNDDILERYHPQDTDHKICKLKEEIAKLKIQLDGALKRIEEME